MAIKLPETKVLNRDQLRAQYMAQHKTFTRKVEVAVLDLIAHHRSSYEALLFKGWWDDIQRFIESRQPNGTPYDDIVRQEREQQRTDYDRERRAKERMSYLSRYTTLPEWRWKGDARPGLDFPDHHEWEAWLDNLERPAFKVEFLPTAKADLKRRAKEYVDSVARQFAHKTVDKVIDILLAKGRQYECHLDKGHFTFDGFEGDIRITFADQTGFRTHVIVKDNTSVLGNPYVQYPLTFHEIVGQAGEEPVAMLSQEEVFERFRVKRWEAPKKVKKPWSNVKVGDLVQTNTLSMCMVLGIRGTLVTVFNPNTGESKIDGSAIKTVLARTRVENWNDRVGYKLRIEPHQGKEYTVQLSEEEMSRIRQMPYGLRKDTETRKACLSEAMQLWHSQFGG
jgi:hypothetical protein